MGRHPRKHVHRPVDRLVAGLAQGCGLPGGAGPGAGGALHRVLTRRSAPARAFDLPLRQARRSARQGDPRDPGRRVGQADDHRRCPLPQRLHPLRPGMEGGQRARRVRVQPAGAPGLSGHRDRRRNRGDPGRDLRGARDLLQLLQQAVPPRPRRRPGDHLDVGARRVEPPLHARRRDGAGEAPDYERRLAGSRRGQRGRGAPADLVPRERNEPRTGSLLRSLLSDRLRRHRAGGLHGSRRHARGHLLPGP